MKRTIILILAAILFVCPFAFGQEDNDAEMFKWSGYTGFEGTIEGAFVGISGGALIVAGGVSESGEYIDTISVLEEGAESWKSSFELDKSIGFGSTVSVDEGMIIIGGRDADKCYSNVALIKWDSTEKKIEIKSLPDLPRSCAYSSACVIGKKIYVAGGVYSLSSRSGENNFWVLDLSVAEGLQWEELESWPGEGRISAVTAAQISGEKNSFYIFGGKGGVDGEGLNDCYRYDWFEKEEAKRWKRIADVDIDVAGMSGAKTGQSHILLFGSKKAGEIIVYHTITDTWVTKDWGPQGISLKALWWGEEIVSIGGREAEDSAHPVFTVKPEYIKGWFGIANYITLGGYLCILVWVGYYFSKKAKSSEDFFLAGKRVPWWAAGMSIFATTFSAISFMSAPAKVYSTDWLYFLGGIATMPLIVFTIYCFIPFVHRLNVTTAYEYLEQRFNLWVRMFGSMVFILYQFGRMAIVLLLPALALATVTGIGVQTCILTMGILCIIYTVMGGIEAVIWNDCLQTVVLLGTALGILMVVAFSIDGGFGSVISIGMADSKFRVVNLTWDHTVAALWIVLIGNCLSNAQLYISDQAVIQRYLTTPDLKQAKGSLWFTFWIYIPQAALFFMLGTVLYGYYKTHPGQLNPVINTDAIVPWFVVQKMPAGVCGLMIAGIFAASMSSLDSSMHAVTTAIMNDFYKRFHPKTSDKVYFLFSRWATAIIGVVGTGMAVLVSIYNIPSLWDLFMRILGLLGGGVTGIFLLGILTKRATGAGALIGAIVSVVLVFAAQTYTRMHFFLYGAIGLVSAMLVGYLASLVIPVGSKSLDGLTVYTVPKE